MRKVFGILSLMASLAMLGCGPKDATTSAGGSPPATASGSAGQTPAGGGPESTLRAPAGGASGAITPQNTKIEFVGTKAGGKHNGGFKSFSGSIKPVEGDVTGGTIVVEIDTDSLYTDADPKLGGHLRSPDFFDVKKYPKASFVSRQIKAEKKDDNTHVITGDLTLHGTTKTVSLPARVSETPDTLTLNSTFTIDRLEFGIAYSPAQVNKEVTIKVSANVPRK